MMNDIIADMQLMIKCTRMNMIFERRSVNNNENHEE
jgi:hypothetical protein